MSKDPTISVVIPSYNRAQTLPWVLKALRYQEIDGSVYEIIVVDDGSSDSTKQAVSPYFEAGRPKVIYLVQANQGAAAARNLGAANACGRLILFIDADVIPQSNMLREHLIFHRMYIEETDVALGGVEMPAVLSNRSQIRQNETRLRFDTAEIASVPWHCFRASNISLKRSFLELGGGFDVAMNSASEDTELAFRLKREGMHLYYVARALAYHYHPMKADEYIRKAAAYGESMATWYQCAPEARAFLIKHYGLLTEETPQARVVKYLIHKLIFNRVTHQSWMVLVNALRCVSMHFSDFLYNELYKAQYRRTFNEHLKNSEKKTKR